MNEKTGSPVKSRSRLCLWLKRIFGLAAIGVIAIAVIIAAAYFRDMHRNFARIQGKSKMISSPYGEIEYTEGGTGPAVLVVHGSGGGYDQGELLAEAVLGDDYHWITPSRFGYLRSTFKKGATWDEQAHAYAYLLDRMGVENVAVVALSQGGPSALLFTLLYPERVSSLTLISCGVASSEKKEQAQANRKGDMLTKIFSKDLPYWAVTTLFRKQFLELMGANEAVIAGLTPTQKKQVEHLIDYMNPVSVRAAGVAFDNKAKMPGERIREISAPTLILHATDDTLQLFHNAEFAAANIPGARLMKFDRGGHLLTFVEQTKLREAIRKHILDNTREE